MAAEQQTVYKIDIEDRPGALQEVLASTAEAGANVVFMAAFSTGGGKGAAYVITDNPLAVKEIAVSRGMAVEEFAGFLLGGADRVGLGAEVTKMVADAGVNVVLSAATVAGGEFQLLIMVDPGDADATARALA